MVKKQTAVDWLVSQVKLGDKSFDEFFRGEIQQAKAIEKEQIMQAYKHGEVGEIYELNPIKTLTAKQYYENNYEKIK